GLLLQLGGYRRDGRGGTLGDLHLDAVVLVGERDVVGRPLPGPALRVDQRVPGCRVRVAEELLVVRYVAGRSAGGLRGGSARGTRADGGGCGGTGGPTAGDQHTGRDRDEQKRGSPQAVLDHVGILGPAP